MVSCEEHTRARTHGECPLFWFRRGRNSSQAIFGMLDLQTLAKINGWLSSVRYGALLVTVPPAVRCVLSLTKGAVHGKGLRNVTVPLATISPCPSNSSHLRATNRKQKMKVYIPSCGGSFSSEPLSSSSRTSSPRPGATGVVP